MGEGGCLDSCLEKVVGFFLMIFIVLPICLVLSVAITFGVYYLIDALILKLINLKFFVIVLYVIGYVIKAILTYLVFGGIISPSTGDSTKASRIFEYKYQSVFRTIISVIVALIYELGGYILSLSYSYEKFISNDNISAITSDAMVIAIAIMLIATTIVTAVVRFRSIDHKAYRQSMEENTYNE